MIDHFLDLIAGPTPKDAFDLAFDAQRRTKTMRPFDIDWRDALNAPEWTESELRNLINICEEKIGQILRARRR